jgi:hypothetical protein
MLKPRQMENLFFFSALTFRPSPKNRKASAAPLVPPQNHGVMALLRDLLRTTCKILLVVLLFFIYLFLVCGTKVLMALVSG